MAVLLGGTIAVAVLLGGPMAALAVVLVVVLAEAASAVAKLPPAPAHLMPMTVYWRTPSTGQSPQGGDGETPTDEGASDGDGDQAMIDGNGGAKLANAPEDFSVQLAAFGDAVEKETMLLEDVLSTYRIPA